MGSFDVTSSTFGSEKLFTKLIVSFVSFRLNTVIIASESAFEANENVEVHIFHSITFDPLFLST